jgi:hypothetical protein
VCVCFFLGGEREGASVIAWHISVNGVDLVLVFITRAVAWVVQGCPFALNCHRRLCSWPACTGLFSLSSS